jgi:hypothetical protein
MQATPFRQEIETEWENMLGHQLPKPLPPFDSFWSDLGDVFGWLDGTLPTTNLPRAGGANLDATWTAPRAITSWRRGFPMELLRYAGANRLKVDIDYRAETGRIGPRRVEPYSLRRTADGNLVLFVVNDLRQLRTYRVDRVAGIRPTTETFQRRCCVDRSTCSHGRVEPRLAGFRDTARVRRTLQGAGRAVPVRSRFRSVCGGGSERTRDRPRWCARSAAS